MLALTAASCWLGCSFDGTSPPQGTSDAAPDVDSRSAPAPDAAIDAPPLPGDADGDGIDDPDDNCASVANPNQENEDGDAFGNACDLCIAVDDGVTAQADGDGDGFGDGCDPQPTEQNSLIFFEGFDSAIDDNEWFQEELWNQDVQAGLMRRANNTVRAYLIRRDVEGADDVYVVAGMDFADESGGAGFGGVLLEVSGAGNNHRGTWLTRDGNGNGVLGWIGSLGNDPIIYSSVTSTLVENQRYEFRHSLRDGNTHVSSVSSVDGTRSVNRTSDNDFSGDDVGVVTNFATANVYYLYAIRLQ